MSRSSRLAPIIATTASGSSTTSASVRLSMKPGVPQSSVVSNHASQQSRVASTTRQRISTWRRRQAAQAVAAKATNSTASNPTQAALQPPAR